ncbi:MAG TPA: hypothetical protein DCZ10_07915 [Pelotomaculum sp.]|nr:hypothetical protein [Pelotomaculum sp.]
MLDNLFCFNCGFCFLLCPNRAIYKKKAYE